MQTRLKRFINERVEVQFFETPTLEKKPGCPDSFVWREKTYKIIELISEWHDYQRRGRMARNMSSEHSSRAERTGSWGVGQDYYRVLTEPHHIFDLYFDRAPKNVDHRKGAWYLDRELEQKP